MPKQQQQMTVGVTIALSGVDRHHVAALMTLADALMGQRVGIGDAVQAIGLIAPILADHLTPADVEDAPRYGQVERATEALYALAREIEVAAIGADADTYGNERSYPSALGGGESNEDVTGPCSDEDKHLNWIKSLAPSAES